MSVGRRMILAGLAAILAAGPLGPVVLAGDRSGLQEAERAGNERRERIAEEGDRTGSEATAAAARWLGPDGEPLPFRTDDEVLEFLAAAEIVATEDIDVGVTRPLRVLLEKDGVRLRAIFRYGDVSKRNVHIMGRYLPRFRDHYIYEKAAYELARLLGLHAVPPVIVRRVAGSRGTLQLWIESSVTEKQRQEEHLKPPRRAEFLRQVQTMRAFDALIANFDRNLGNIIYDADWKLWCIDHTRSFLPKRKIAKPELDRVSRCERRFWQGLRTVGDDEIRACLKPYLERDQISGVLGRRAWLVGHIQGLIDARGEDAVLFDLSWSGSSITAPPS